jgi:hypothetical protein
MLTQRMKRLATGAVLAGAATTAVAMGTMGPASAASYQNWWYGNYSSSTECNSQKDWANQHFGYPKNDQYFYCGGPNGASLWLRYIP